jgi:transcription initiation factor TFIIIB Brf1 subunit/transcription initiation factor TFIIB
MLVCDRCGRHFFKKTLTMIRREHAYSWICGTCGNVIDRTILQNRSPAWRAFWRAKTDAEFSGRERAQKILAAYEETALIYGA